MQTCVSSTSVVANVKSMYYMYIINNVLLPVSVLEEWADWCKEGEHL